MGLEMCISPAPDTNKLSIFEQAQRGDLTNSEWLEERLVNIPSSVL